MKHIYGGILFLLSLHLTTGKLAAQCNYTTAVPYYESFEGISVDNELPACWISSNPSVTCLTYTSTNTQNRVPRTGSKFPSFYASPTGTNYFYSNGILLNAGYTYSASVWFTSNFNGGFNWTDLSILIGPSQTPAAQILVASTNTPGINSGVYRSLSNTFSVAVTGIYYAAIRATSNASSGVQYLSFDDFLIEQYCNVNLGIASSATSLCQGVPVTFTASGADTFTWSNGATGPVVTFTPISTATMGVLGTQTVDGCIGSASVGLPLYPSPNVTIFNPAHNICLGDSVILNSAGATTYTWGTGPPVFSPTIVVSPTVTTTYTLVATNQFGCSGATTAQVIVRPLPTVTVSSSIGMGTACLGDTVTITGMGASTFTWISASGLMIGNPVEVIPGSSVTYTIEGMGANGCKDKTTFELHVSDCTGIGVVSGNTARPKVFPNPCRGEFIIELESGTEKTIQVFDLTGRVIQSTISDQDSTTISLNGFASGIYFVKVNVGITGHVFRIVKE